MIHVPLYLDEESRLLLELMEQEDREWELWRAEERRREMAGRELEAQEWTSTKREAA